MTRDPNALAAYLDARADWPFSHSGAPGTHDCARFVAGGVKAVTGHDPLRDFGSAWTTARGARRVLRRRGGMAAAVGAVMTAVPTTLARRGDAGMTADGALVLVEGETVVGLDPTQGQVRLPRAAMVQAWTVPEITS